MSAPPVLPTAGFSQIENDVLLNPNITIEAKGTLGLLKYFDRGNGRGCFARKETLCHFLSVSPYRLRKALTELYDLGLITITRRGQGNPDIIRVVCQEGPKESEPLQVDVDEVKEVEIDPIDEVEEELQEELDQVAEEPPEVAPVDLPEPQGKTDDSESQDVKIKTDEFSPVEHYREENKDKNKYSHTTTKPDHTEPLGTDHQKKQCDEDKLISYFYEEKEGRKPTRNEIYNWRPTAIRLLEEFSYDELIPAVKNAVAKGARLFYFVALTAPGFILEQRQGKQTEIERLKRAEKAIEQENGRKHQLEELRRSAAVYHTQTEDLLRVLSTRLRPQSFNVWFARSFIVASDEKSISLCVESASMADWIHERYGELLREVAEKEVKVISV